MPDSASNALPPVVAVTGASRGIGHAIVKEFHAAGWEVFTLARTPFSAACPWADGIIKHIEVDLADRASIGAACERLQAQLGDRGLDALVNNAGISPKSADGGRLGATETTHQIMQTVQAVNLVAPLELANRLLPRLKAAGGSIVNVTSIAGSKTHPFAGAAYAISKAGLSALTRELASEYGSTGVRVNAVAPGEIETSILSPGTEELVHREVPMDRIGRPEEVAEVVHFLCGPKASYINGAEIHINGGQHL